MMLVLQTKASVGQSHWQLPTLGDDHQCGQATDVQYVGFASHRPSLGNSRTVILEPFYCPVQYSTVHYSTLQYSTVQYS